MLELVGITWDHVRGTGGLRACADAFGREYADVAIAWSTRSLQSFADQSVAELAARFDLLYVDHPAIGEAAARGCLLPLDAHLDPKLLADHDRATVGASARSYIWDEHRWAMATDAAAQVAVMRSDLLERVDIRVPRDWDEALRVASELPRAGLWAALPSIPVDAVCSFLAVCAALGERPFAEADRVVSPPAGAAALDILSAFVERSHPASLEWNPPQMLEHMSERDDVAYCPLAFGYSNYGRSGFRRHRLRFASGPAADAAAPSGTLGGAGLAVSASARARDAAVAFVAFVATERMQRGPYFDGGGQPAHRAAWTDGLLDEVANGFFGDTLIAVERAYLRPRYDGFLRFQQEAGALVHAHLRARSEPARTLGRIDDAYRASLTGVVS